ncbi:MAG: hypothetical protein ACTSO7_17890 [Candidatus Heimdallarchaeota archaeon]
MNNDILQSNEELQEKIDSVKRILQENNYAIGDIFASELIAYFEGEAPSGDVISLQDILNSSWLLIHELVEINELKKKGLEISSKLLFTHSEVVFETHLIATEWELKLAAKGDDLDHVKNRIKDVKTWLEDPTLSSQLKKKCNDLLLRLKDNFS